MVQLSSINPNKHVRKALSDAIAPLYPVFDTEVPGDVSVTDYVVLSTQSKEIDKANKCNYLYESTTLIDITNEVNGAGNTGSRVAVDDIQEAVFNAIQNITIANFEVVNRSFSFPNGLETIGANKIIYRNFIRVTLLLK